MQPQTHSQENAQLQIQHSNQHQLHQQQRHCQQMQQNQRRPPMQRGYSDLGHRIKKRVTLR